MVATVVIQERNGATGAGTTKSTGGGNQVRFKNAENATVDTNNPMIVPTAGNDYSFEKALQLNATGGTFTTLDNLKFYTDGTNSFGTGVSWKAKKEVAYSQPVHVTATTGAPNATPAYANATTFTAGTPLALAGSAVASATGFFGDLVYQFVYITTTTTAGTKTETPITFSYDEV
jgi:hypothetical protein